MKPAALVILIVLIAAGAFIFRPKTNAPIYTPIPTPSPRVQVVKPAETSVENPDGTKKLIMRTQKLSGTSTTYTFLVADTAGERTIFTQTADTATSYTIPANTWSPEKNTYVFLEERTISGTHFLVLKASGQAFREEEQYLDVSGLFANTPNKYRIKDITGWDSPQLLHVLTVTDEGARGPSFWFDVESRVFLQLASS